MQKATTATKSYVFQADIVRILAIFAVIGGQTYADAYLSVSVMAMKNNR